MAELNEDQIRDVNAEVLEHMMNPKNYGSIDDASAVGIGLDPATGEYAVIYLDMDEDDNIRDIKYGCKACQDTVIAGSLFTEMVKGATLTYGIEASKRLAIKIQDAPPKQQACSGMVIKGFEAAILHLKSRAEGGTEDMVTVELGISCEGVENK
ncbi:MAG: iron-sulfur cluster assembly scaffold protein [Arcobacteraceae bacterium]|nr:iron-sulfur cluster assembly scaffold protein [Arcobacteraceae bacterium]